MLTMRDTQVLTGPNKGKDFTEVNHKGNVPAIVLEDGTLLNGARSGARGSNGTCSAHTDPPISAENAATLQWVADQAPNSGLAPPAGTAAHYTLLNKLSFIGTEVHQACAPLFSPCDDKVKEWGLTKLKGKLKFVAEDELKDGRMYLIGDCFTVADSYLYIVLSWMPYVGVDLAEYPVLKKYFDGIAALDFVQKAHLHMKQIEESSR